MADPQGWIDFNSQIGQPRNTQDENWVLYNSGRNVGPSFNFMLRVEGFFDLPCRKIMNFTKANEYEYIQEGGLNDYVHMRRKPVSQPFTFQVERYVGVDYIDPLQPGADLILPIVLLVWRQQIKGGEFTPFRVYLFTGCTVMSKTYGELNAEQSGLLTETTTIGYRELMRITVPDGLFEGTAFQMANIEKATDENGNVITLTGADGKTVDKKKAVFNEDAKTVANHSFIDDIPSEKVLWEGIKDGKASTVNTRAIVPKNDDVRPDVSLWEGMPEKSTTVLRGQNSVLPDDLKTAEARTWDINADKTTNKSARSPEKDNVPATALLWSSEEGNPTKNLRAVRPDKDKVPAVKVAWDGSSTQPVRAQGYVDENGQAKTTDFTGKQGDPWNGFSDPMNPSSTPKYATASGMDGTTPPPEMWPDVERANRQPTDAARAESALWPGQERARRQGTDPARAEQVLWPKNSRAMTVELLKRGGK
ncbi:MAG: hypothetical protein K6E50_11980 [Lachnospiraceae bacterium]|nr:hypothetical protein [Lachnospiraceae bacterium]